jgi:hypothetical protein
MESSILVEESFGALIWNDPDSARAVEHNRGRETNAEQRLNGMPFYGGLLPFKDFVRSFSGGTKVLFRPMRSFASTLVSVRQGLPLLLFG